MKLGVYTACLHDKPLGRGPRHHRRPRPDQRRRSTPAASSADRTCRSTSCSRARTPARSTSASSSSRGVDADRPELQRQPARPDPGAARPHAEDLERLHRARRPARRQAGDHHVRAPGRQPGGDQPGVERRCPGGARCSTCATTSGTRSPSPTGRRSRRAPRMPTSGSASRCTRGNIVFNPVDDAPPRRGDRLDPRRRRDGPEPPVLAGHRPRAGRQGPRLAGVRRRRQGHPDQRRRPRSTACSTTGSPASPRASPATCALGGGTTLLAVAEQPRRGTSWRSAGGTTCRGGPSSCAPCSDVDPDMPVNIEHEDQELDQLEGLTFAANTLLEAEKAL